MYKNLVRVRREKHLTIDDMSKIISKSPANYYKKEQGMIITTVEEAILIAKFLGYQVEELFDKEEWKKH